MPTPPTPGSTPRLSEVARHVVYPSGIVTSAWPRVVAQCEDMGVQFDPWQHGIGTIALGKSKNGKYAATVGGVVLSIPRQVGKTFLVGMIVIALCVLFPGYTVLWTAHRTRTATKTFQTLQGMVRRKKIWPHVAAIRSTNGEQEIRFRNGSVIMFGAREQGFGRGFDEVDAEIFDEGQILTEKALEDMVPAANQSRHESGALLFFMGTPPRPTDPGEEFTNRRRRALSGKADNMVYVEFSADQNASCDDREQWAKANPSYPSRTPLESMERMRENLTDDDSFRREALGIWDDDDTSKVFAAGAWDEARKAQTMCPVGALSLAVSIDLKHAAIVAAGKAERVVVKPLQHGPGSEWTIARARELQQIHRVPVIIDGRGPGAGLIPHLKAAGVRLHVCSTVDVLDAFDTTLDLVDRGELEHAGYPELDKAVAGATTRNVGDRTAWARRTSSVDISPLEGMSLAAWWVSRPSGGLGVPPAAQVLSDPGVVHPMRTQGF